MNIFSGVFHVCVCVLTQPCIFVGVFHVYKTRKWCNMFLFIKNMHIHFRKLFTRVVLSFLITTSLQPDPFVIESEIVKITLWANCNIRNYWKSSELLSLIILLVFATSHWARQKSWWMKCVISQKKIESWSRQCPRAKQAVDWCHKSTFLCGQLELPKYSCTVKVSKAGKGHQQELENFFILWWTWLVFFSLEEN